MHGTDVLYRVRVFVCEIGKRITPDQFALEYMGQCKRKLGFCNFFQVFKFNSFWIQDSAPYKTVLTHPKLDSVS